MVYCAAVVHSCVSHMRLFDCSYYVHAHNTAVRVRAAFTNELIIQKTITDEIRPQQTGYLGRCQSAQRNVDGDISWIS